MSTEETDVSQTVMPTPLTEILDTHAKLETQVGEIYINFVALFGQDLPLRTLWSTMALEEGGHAALIRAVNKGLLSGVLQAKSFLLPLELLSALETRITEYHHQAEAGV